MSNPTESESTKTEIASLRLNVKRSRIFLISVTVVILFAYFVYFGLAVKAPFGMDPGSWGQLGDYVGGILNPIIAFFAFYWLSQSVLIQKEELADTKKALQESAQAQLQQGKHAAKTAEISALNTLLTSHDSDISNVRNNIEFTSSQLHGSSVWLMNGNVVTTHDAVLHIQKLNDALVSALEKRNTLRDKISKLLETID